MSTAAVMENQPHVPEVIPTFTATLIIRRFDPEVDDVAPNGNIVTATEAMAQGLVEPERLPSDRTRSARPVENVASRSARVARTCPSPSAANRSITDINGRLASQN